MLKEQPAYTTHIYECIVVYFLLKNTFNINVVFLSTLQRTYVPDVTALRLQSDISKVGSGSSFAYGICEFD